MKRKLKWIAVVLVVLSVGLGVALFLWPRDSITRSNWDKIQIGMTEEQVKAILGGPGITDGEYEIAIAEGRFPFVHNDVTLEEPEWNGERLGDLKVWIGQNAVIGIQFREGGVVRRIFQGIRRSDPSFLDRLRDWLGW
jgi:hypothetical protein